MLIERDSRRVEARRETTAANGGRPPAGREAVAVTDGAGSPPPLEAAWLDVVGPVAPRRGRGCSDDAGIFPRDADR